MKTFKYFVLLTAVAFVSVNSYAESISATSTTMEGAEAKIASQAHQRGEHYKVTEANTNNYVHMTAELYK